MIAASIFTMFSKLLVFATVLVATVLAKTDLAGCTSSRTVVNGGASAIWYVPDTGEICAFLDCGGGRAPPKTTVPGCPLYEGAATYSPSFLPNFGASSTSAASSAVPTPSGTASPTGSPSASITRLPGSATTGSDVTVITGTKTSSAAGSSTSVTVITSTDASGATKTFTSSVIVPTGASQSGGSGSSSGGSASSSSSSTAAAPAMTAGVRKLLGLAAGVVGVVVL